MKLSAAIEDYLIDNEVRKYTPKTIRGRRINLNGFAKYCSQELGIDTIEEISPAVIKHFTKFMVSKGRKGTYINGILKSLKSFIQYCYDEGYGGYDTKKGFKWCKEEKPVIITFEPEQVRSMLMQCSGGSYIDVRDKAILTTLFETGIRCWELCCITPKDIRADYIIINGKNHKQRVVPITAVLKKALLKYERARENYFCARVPDDFYFLSFHGHQLTNSAIENLIKNRAKGIEGVRVSPHTCRHFFAQQHVKMGTDLYTISRLLGHENIKITQTYLDSLRDRDVITIAKERSVIMNL
jgi:integrase/recombinase XerD